MNTPPESLPIDLPDGWIHTTMDAVVESMKNGVYKPANKYAENGVACLRMYNIDDGKIVWKNIKRMLLTSDEVNEYRLVPGDLLVNRVNSRELVGKAAVFPAGLEDCVYESKNIRVRLLAGLANSDFVNYQFLLFGQHHFNYNAQQVVGMASISQPQIAGLQLLLPPRIEQERIVSKVRGLLAEVGNTRARIANVAKILKRFRQAVLAAACSGKLTEDWREEQPEVEPASLTLERIRHERSTGKQVNTVPVDSDELPELPDSWAWARFGVLLGELRNGISTKPELSPPGVSILRISSVRSGSVLLNERRFLQHGADLLPQYGLRDGDLLFTRYNGSLDLLGVCGMVRGLGSASMLYPDKLMRVRFDHDNVLPAYAELFFQSAGARDRLTAQSRSSAGQQGVSGADIKSQPFALPPFAEQVEIIDRVSPLLTLADTIENRLGKALIRSDKLTQSILAKAFRGELVLTEAELARREGREYEPASVLLERIKKQREQVASNQPKRRRTLPKTKLVTARG